MTSPESFICKIDENETMRLERNAYDPGLPVESKTSQQLMDALSKELREMIEEDLTVANLNQISRFADIAQDLILVRSPIANVLKKKKRFGAVGIGPINYSSIHDIESDDESLTGEAQPNETFGAKLIREIIPAFSELKAKKQKGIFEELIDGISIAQEKGLDDIAKGLQAKLDHLIKINQPEPDQAPP